MCAKYQAVKVAEVDHDLLPLVWRKPQLAQMYGGMSIVKHIRQCNCNVSVRNCNYISLIRCIKVN